MSGIREPRLELNGRPASVEQVWSLDLSTDGHFTALQVRDRQALGMDFHLARLDAATREMFGVDLPGGQVRAYIRHALADDTPDASIRVHVFRPGGGGDSGTGGAGDVCVMVSVRKPATAPRRPQRLQTVRYQRPLAHLKRFAGFGQGYFASLAEGNGFDEALFVGPDDAISEGSVTNVCFVDGGAITWPDAPALRGVMMQVLQRELTRAGVPWRHAPVRVADLAAFGGALVTNSRGMAAVAQIDGLSLPADAGLLQAAAQALAGAPYDPI